jgi:hypothetical protein
MKAPSIRPSSIPSTSMSTGSRVTISRVLCSREGSDSDRESASVRRVGPSPPSTNILGGAFLFAKTPSTLQVNPVRTRKPSGAEAPTRRRLITGALSASRSCSIHACPLTVPRGNNDEVGTAAVDPLHYSVKRPCNRNPMQVADGALPTSDAYCVQRNNRAIGLFRTKHPFPG